MSYNNGAWGTWKFSPSSQEKLKLLKSRFICTSENPEACRNFNNSLWRLLIEKVVIRNGTDSTHNFKVPCSSEGEMSSTDVNYEYNSEATQDNYKTKPISPCNFQDSLMNIEEELNNLRDSKRDTECTYKNKRHEENDAEMIEIVAEICDTLKTAPVKSLTSKLKGKESDLALKTIKDNFLDEESISNLILSVCSPIEEDLLEQSRWIPSLCKQILLPQLMERTLPVPRSLSSAISVLSSCFPDSCVQFLCIPLLISSFQQENSTELSQTIVEILTKVIEESLPPQQRIVLLRAFFSGTADRRKHITQENLLPILLMLAETQGAFIGADSEYLSRIIDWLEVTSQGYYSNIKFAKLLVAILKGISQDHESHKEASTRFLSPENILQLKNTVSQNKTFLKKIAEKTLNSFC